MTPGVEHPSLSRKLAAVVLTTTMLALLLSGAALLVYELRRAQASWMDDLETQARMVAAATRPALAAGNPRLAGESLALLELRPQIVGAAVYRADGTLFARYERGGDPEAAVPARPGPPGFALRNDRAELTQPIFEREQPVGTVYLRARFDILGRLLDYLLILAAVMLTSLGIATLLSTRLRRSLTAPILGVTQVARNVLRRRDFSLRATKTSDDEVGTLVDAFNKMLEEVGKRTEALEQSNRQLSAEMAERRRAEEALRAAARTKDQFLATLAHELRNPLAPITNAVEILRRAGLEAPAQRRALDIMARQVHQMVRLIDDLLDVSRITTGKVLLDTSRVDLVAVIHSAVETASPGIAARRHRLELALPQGPVFLTGDATRLAQVFANLLDNAAKYTEEGGRIAIRLEETAGEVAVHVEDTGMGIAPEKQADIFDMFVQVEAPSSRIPRSGLGVGLTLARQLVELHGGRIEVHSRGLGAGSQFVVHLHRDAVPAEAHGARGTPFAPERPPSPTEPSACPCPVLASPPGPTPPPSPSRKAISSASSRTPPR